MPWPADAMLDLTQLLGMLGAATYMVNYALLTSRVICPERAVYYVLNGVAAALVLVSLAGAFNAASLVIQLFWIVVSAWGIATRLARRRRDAAA